MNDIVAHFGLRRMPFTKDIKTQDVVETEPLTECLARLDFMKRSGGIMLLTGDPGVGKTLALRRFVNQLNDNLFRPLYTPLSTLNRADLLRHINDKLGLPHRASKSAVYAQIQRELLDSREQKGKTVVLIIDEGHLLQVGPLQELRLLTNFKMDSFDPFILVLGGQTDLRRVMDYAILEALCQRLTLRYHMPPMEKAETKTYIEQQMRLAGAAEPLFDDGSMAAVHDVTFGIPRRIGTVAIQALTYAMFAGLRSVDAEVVFKIRKGT
jgi:type II secretory pathway predicted ATPase ExeA